MRGTNLLKSVRKVAAWYVLPLGQSGPRGTARLSALSERGRTYLRTLAEQFSLNFAVPIMNMVSKPLHPNADQTGYIF